MDEIKVKIRDRRIAVLLKLSEETPYPRKAEEIVEEALDRYFRRQDVKSQFIVPLLKRGMNENTIKHLFPGDDRITAKAIDTARSLVNDLEHITKKIEEKKKDS